MRSGPIVLAVLFGASLSLSAVDPTSLGRRLLIPDELTQTQLHAEWAAYSPDEKRRAAPTLLKEIRVGLRSGEPGKLRAAVSGIAMLGPLAKGIVPDLIDLCHRKDSSENDLCGPAVGDALSQIGPAALPELVALQGHDERALPPFAIDAIGAMKGSVNDLRPGALALSETALRCDAQTTWQALEALRHLGPLAAAATSNLVRLIENPCAVPEQSLDDSTDSEMAFSGSQAIVVLGSMGPAAVDAVPTILEAVPVDPDNAVHALAQIGRPGIPLLLKALQSPHEVFREASARALTEMGPKAIEATPTLQKSLEDASPRVRAASARALMAIGPQNALLFKRVAKLLFDSDAMVRLEVADVFHIGKAAEIVLPELVRALEDPEAEVRLRAMDDIGSLGPLAREVIPDIVLLLKDPNESVRQTAALALAALGAPEQNSVSRLVATLSDEDVRLRLAAADLLGEMGQEAASAVPALEIASQDIDPDVQKVAKRAIGRIQSPTATESILPDNQS